MWEAARAANVPYFEAAMAKIRAKSVEAFNDLEGLGRSKWTRCGFKVGSKCDMLTNNHAEAFNICIIKARDQPILTLLNTMHQIVMSRLTVEHREKQNWGLAVCPRVHNILQIREGLTDKYSTRFCGNLMYEVTSQHHSYSVDLGGMVCTCGLWQLSGIPCIHAVCVYQKENQDPRRYVDQMFFRETFLTVYSHFLLPLGGPTFWPKTNYTPILPPKLRVLPGRPKKNRRIDPQELREKAEKAAAARADKAKKRKMGAHTGEYKASRKGVQMTCKHCHNKGHNKRTCPDILVTGLADSEGGGGESSAPARETMSQPTPATESTAHGDGSSSRPAPSTQPPRRTRRKTRSSM